MFRAKTISLPPSDATPSTFLAAEREAEEEGAAWAFEMDLYRTCLLELGLEGETLDHVFEGNARSFYRI